MKLAYDHYKPPKGKENEGLSPIIFLHGVNDSRKTWMDIAQKVTKETGREAYAYDTRNHGDSPWSKELYLDDLVIDLEEFMNEHDIRRAILIGHSVGGRTAIAFTLKKPNAVEKLILEDSGIEKKNPSTIKPLLENVNLLRKSIKSVPTDATEDEARQAIVDFLRKYLLPAQPCGTSRTIYDIHTVPIKKEGETYVLKTNLDAVEDMIRTGKEYKVFSGFFNGDVLLIYGTKSFLRLKEEKELYNLFPRLITIPVEDVGHLIHQVCPEKFSKLITDFIKQQEDIYF